MSGVPGVYIGEKEGEIPAGGPGTVWGFRGVIRAGSSGFWTSVVTSIARSAECRRRIETGGWAREGLAGKIPHSPGLAVPRARRHAGLVPGAVGVAGHVGPRGREEDVEAASGIRYG